LPLRLLQVVLDANLACDGQECNVDTPRVIKLTNSATGTGGTLYSVYYEYIRQPCVELSYIANPTLITRAWRSLQSSAPMCADPHMVAAESACCDATSSTSGMCRHEFSSERVTLAMATARCSAQGKVVCSSDSLVVEDATNPGCEFDNPGGYFWKSGQSCVMQVRTCVRACVCVCVCVCACVRVCMCVLV
jgi:hypothetical protein